MSEHRTVGVRRGLLGMSLGAVAALVAWAGMGRAVAPQDPERLGRDLTPLGGERAGNEEGTIPEWTGGWKENPPGYRSGDRRPDPFAKERPLYRVTAANVDEYADHLSEGTVALLKRYPSYRLDVYPTHRTAAAPQWVYDNAKKNVTRARQANGGLNIAGAYGGPPFPIPENGAQVIWNHLLSWRGEAIRTDIAWYIVSAGKTTLASAATLDQQNPYYYQDGSPEKFGGLIGVAKLTTTGPPQRAGENLVVQEPIDQIKEQRRAWVYLVGQRRVRRVPILIYDTPSIITSGFGVSDESYLFNGPIDRYNWKLVGKKEVLVPYNDQAFHAQPPDQVLKRDHLNPDHLRWELHRVWVVEATLAPGKHHVMPKRVFYLDEDSWNVLLSDSWDAKGQLWHVGQAFPLIVPELPAVVAISSVLYDLHRGAYSAAQIVNGLPREYQVVSRRPDSFFTPEALVSGGVR